MQGAYAQGVMSMSPVLTKQLLGKYLFFDTGLSKPAGMACASCHSPAAGFTYPNPQINQSFGPVPGAQFGRFGLRKPPSVAYAAFLPPGPPHYDNAVRTFVGGLFWDGRAPNLAAQATFPLQGANEMNNVFHNAENPNLIVASVERGPYARLFRSVYGPRVFDRPTTAFADIADAIAAYEASPAVSPFASKYDATLKGQAQLTPEELDGLRLVTGSWTGRPGGPAYYKVIQGQTVYKNARCIACHSIPAIPQTGSDLWTDGGFANIGVPRNPHNPYYQQTNRVSNPLGYNPMGTQFVDLGLGGILYPQFGLPAGNMGPGSDGGGDYLQVNGTFKEPTLRNVATVPYSGFVKCYMHNGVFKSLKEVVHFYNTRNLTTFPGEVIDFTQPDPYAELVGTPLWPAPEYPSPDTLRNPWGLPASQGGQLGNLGLTDQEENDIVAFLATLRD
jgi:cytochrome c peroxidase